MKKTTVQAQNDKEQTKRLSSLSKNKENLAKTQNVVEIEKVTKSKSELISKSKSKFKSKSKSKSGSKSKSELKTKSKAKSKIKSNPEAEKEKSLFFDSYFQSEILICQHLLGAESTITAIIALDEVGRGCVAGPVNMCASIWINKAEFENSSLDPHPQTWLALIKDSKKLSPDKRQECFSKVVADFLSDDDLQSLSQFVDKQQINKQQKNVDIIFGRLGHKDLVSSTQRAIISKQEWLMIKNPKDKTEIQKSNSGFYCVGFSFGGVTSAEINKINIWQATQLAGSRALLALYQGDFFANKKHPLNKQKITEFIKQAVIFMDGKLCIQVPRELKSNRQIAVVDGDDILITIGFSSVMAKVYRDDFMAIQEDLFPSFSFAKHKGYGTSEHRDQIKLHGLTPLHRVQFCSNFIKETPDFVKDTLF